MRQSGAVRLELIVAALILLALLGFFLQRAQELQRNMERMIVDAEVSNLRTALQLAVAASIVRGEELGLGAWERRNPLQLAGRDEVAGLSPTRSAGGASLTTAWQWDATQGALVYHYVDGETLRLRLGRVPLDGREGWALGGGLLLLRERSGGN